ncbi:small multidrug resistance pump [Thalassobacillus cyri]|uniref:Small multidrug resistance pump n=1 Tax=Thalassobacillus cyri TaxID=571932 RepID=A0A1H3WF55_9BACI|nr:multidrug efflux SMR transporter [Thalassobacillus cyri]SDZ85725.1 small multidrug resistance pump [Thalassobacillus cyri]
MNNYLLLTFSIFFEVIGTSFMKISEGFTKAGPTLIVVACYGIALSLYVVITRSSEIGIINAIWSGGGVVVVTIIAVSLFHEPLSMVKVLGTTLILAGVVGLNLPEQRETSPEKR